MRIDPEIFNLAACNVGLKPSECIGIEDAEAGIEAINKSGALAIGVGDKEALPEARFIVGSTSKLNFSYLQACWYETRDVQ